MWTHLQQAFHHTTGAAHTGLTHLFATPLGVLEVPVLHIWYHVQYTHGTTVYVQHGRSHSVSLLSTQDRSAVVVRYAALHPGLMQ